jgi:hypothetical protein
MMHHGAVPLLRVLSMFGLALIFLLISPTLRLRIADGLTMCAGQMELYRPYSYVGLVVAIILGFIISLNRGTQPQ